MYDNTSQADDGNITICPGGICFDNYDQMLSKYPT
ncbi:hypothetical protein COPEUT_02776 [Coprococcus eutactus ATCC 27759]|nr:hypothetical protein COPEUT_02776 [Coprococcus eutactus ATCC 27759]